MKRFIIVFLVGLVGFLANTKLEAQVITVGSQCYRPGPMYDNICTVPYRITNNPADNKICVWVKENNGLIACEGRQLWAAGYDGVPASGQTLEFRRHLTWPTMDPRLPTNPSAVRLDGNLLKSQFVTSKFRTSPNNSCTLTVQTGQNIQAAINGASINATICIAAGIHLVGSTIRPKSGQTLRSASSSNRATLRATSNQNLVSVETSGVTVKWLNLEGTVSARPTFGIVGVSASDLLVDSVYITRTLIGFGATDNSSNVELRASEIAYTGDGLKPGADPAIWINNSNNVRIMKSALLNNGNSPEGDGELACYNTPNLVVHNTTVSNSGASGMYLVNCDYAVVSGNHIVNAGEWGLDLANTGQPSGTDYGLFSWNLIEGSRHGAGVVWNSLHNTFQSNEYIGNRIGPNASGSCNGINRRGNSTGYYFVNDVASPWPVVCND